MLKNILQILKMKKVELEFLFEKYLNRKFTDYELQIHAK